MDDLSFKTAAYAQVARIGKATSHPRRLELLDLLCQGPMTVETLAERIGLSIGSTSQHLGHLRSARLVTATRQGSYVRYRLADKTVCALVVQIRQVAEQRFAELRELVEAFRSATVPFEQVDLATLRERVAETPVVLVDVRPRDEYDAGHWPGALSMPVEELPARWETLPSGSLIAAYCRGPYCVLSLQAARFLQRAGVPVVRVADGVGDWRAAGARLVGHE